MRLEGQSKLGYYPTPELTLKLILTWLATTGEGLRRYLDPCAGKGEALAAIAAAHGPAETYGIELSDVRAAAAKQVLSHVINTGYEYAVLADETFSLALVNPPYDGQSETGGGVRLEETFLLNTTSRIVPGGILIYLIPHIRLANDRIARHLLGWYADSLCFKLPVDEYDAFKQVVIFGVRRPDYKAPNGDAMREVMEGWARGQIVSSYTETITPDKKKVRQPVFADMPFLTTGNGEYAIPPSPLKGKHGAAFRFQYQMISDEDMLREAEAAAARLDASREWADLVPPTEPPLIEPAMTPKKGHIAMQVSGGLLGTNRVTNAQGQPVLIKGNVRKYTVRKQDDLEEVVREVFDDDEDKPSLKKVVLEERFQTLLTTLEADGTLVTQTDPEAIKALLDQYVAQLAEIVQTRNAPLYDMRPESWEWAAFDQLSKGRLLPGQKEPGLTPFQKHLAIALGRLCLKYGADFCNAEMASGKSRIGLAVAEYLRASGERKANRKSNGAYPALIVGPGIVTGDENWPKEIMETIPDAASRVITVGVKPLPKPARIGQYLQQLGLTLQEEDFEGLSAGSVGNRLNDASRRQGITLSPPVWNAVHDALGRAEKHPPARRKGARKVNLLDGRIGGFAWLGLGIPRDENSAREIAAEYSLAQFVHEYRTGLLPPKSFAILSFETAKLASGRVPALTTRLIKVLRRDEETETEWTEIIRVCACPTCGAVVAGKYDEQGQPILPSAAITPDQVDEWIGLKRRFCQAPLMYFNPHTQRYEPGKRVWDEDRGKHVIRVKDDNDDPYVCGSPLFQNTALRREAAARYVLKKARRFFGLLLVDEVHKAKAKGTGVGWTLTALSQAVRRTVGLTGTLFGGASTSIFWLMHRLSGEVRREFGFDDERRWAERFGLLKTTYYVPEDAALLDDGAYTGTRFFETVTERPGISPAIVGLGLRYCTFSSLKDVGLPLPAYGEEVVRIPMTAAMEAQMASADGSRVRPPEGLLAWALETQKEENGKGAISVWLNTAFHRPNAMFRDEVVTFNRRLSGRGRYAVRRKEVVMRLPAVTGPDEILPKERWLADTCRAELLQGRKTLVYVRQTGERDIQPRLAEILTRHGLRVGIVRASLAPRKRATWIAKNAPKFDVLITNARLVEVGLNLTMLATAIFLNLNSVFTCCGRRCGGSIAPARRSRSRFTSPSTKTRSKKTR